MSARVHPIQTKFTAGELTPRLAGLVDWQKYFAGCKTLENFRVFPHGGVTRRAGTRFVAEVKTSSAATRLIPFRVTEDIACILEFGNLYIRVYEDGAQIQSGGSALEIVSPYATADLFDLHYRQAGEVLVIVHRNYAPRRLVRFDQTTWRLRTVTFFPPASYEFGLRSTTYLVPDAVSGSNVQFDAGASIFLASDVNRDIIAGPGKATIITVDSASRVHANITDDFLSTAQIAAGNWHISGSPQTTCTPSTTGPVGAGISLSLSSGGFRSEDVGKFVQINAGVVEITGFSSALDVSGLVRTELAAVTGAPPDAWSLEEAAWSTLNVYPSEAGFFEGRLLLGGTSEQPETWWGSSSLDPYDFALGSTDDAALEFAIASGTLDRVRWFAGRKVLLIGTAGGEWTATGGADNPITPSNIQVRAATSHGSSDLMPIQAERAVIFATGSNRKLREMAFVFETDDYAAPDLLMLAEHLTASSSVVDLAFAEEPDPTIYAVRADGVLLQCTYLRQENVVGWHRHVTDGAYESVAVVPSPDANYSQVWVIVRRTIGGQTKRYVEYFDPAFVMHSTAPGLNTDAALVYTGTATQTVTGLSHLEGKSVDIVGNGAVYPRATVTSGQVTLAGAATTPIEVGLPYTSTLQTMRPEIQTLGSSQGIPKAWARIVARLDKTLGLKINGQTIPFRSAGDPMDQSPPLFTGDKQVSQLGWDTDAWITITQEQPLPCTVLALTGILVVGD